MSTWFSQAVGFGYITTYEEYERVSDGQHDDQDEAWNREDRTGWWLTDDFAFYGKIILDGEDHGNDTLLAAESGYNQIPRVDADDFSTVCKNLKEMFGEAKDRELDYYVLGHYG